MKIYGLEKLSMVDFGKRCAAVVFTGGCNFRCPFCHNSGLVEGTVTPLDETQVFEYLKKRKGLLDGIVVSGGEPTIQSDLPDFIAKIREMGYAVKLDTNGTNYEMLKSLIDRKLVDFVAMDVKNSISEYPATVGVKNFDPTNILKSIELLKSGVVDYEFRTTLVNGLHTLKSITKMAELLDGAKVLYLQKFVDNGTNIKDNLSEIPLDIAKSFQNILQSHISNVYLRGY